MDFFLFRRQNMLKRRFYSFRYRSFFLSLHRRRIEGNWRQTLERNDRGKHAMCERGIR